MSEQDSFINEVSEEVRRDRLFALMRRWGWVAVLLVILLVGGAAFNEWRKSRAEADAEAAGDALIAALEAQSAEERLALIEGLETDSDPARRAVIELHAASAEVEAGRIDDARTRLEALAAAEEAPRAYRDLAALKALMLGAGEVAPQERIDRLGGLALAGSPWRLLALEQVALAQIEAGQRDAALSTLREILSDAGVTQDLRRRAQQLIVALGGTLTTG